ncbi:hypothetical protein [Lacticaseibacillus sp. GG6-2]
MSKYIVALIFLVGAIWQFFVTYRTVRFIKNEGDHATSAFSPLGLWFSALFGGLMLLASILIVTGVL